MNRAIELSLLMLISSSIAITAHSAEGGADVYLPGFYGDFQIAVLPDKGLNYENYTMYSKAKTDVALRQGQLHIDIDDKIFANLFSLLFTTDKKIFGGRYFASLYVPVMYAGLDALVDSGGVSRSTSASDSGLADWYAVPVGLNWKQESLSISFYEGINVPLGKYDVNDPVNLGLNYWAFDTNVALTWTNKKLPLEVDLNLGYIVNTTNTATDYRSGSSLHLDYTLGFDASQRLSIGLEGYGYRQVSGDSGSGATLGDFKGKSYGLGPVVSYTFGIKKPFVLTGKWLHDMEATNRLKGDYLYLVAFVPL